MPDTAGRRHLLYRGQRLMQRRSLTGIVAGQADSEPEGILNRCDSRRTHGRGQIRNIRQGDRAESGSLNLSLNQSHGPAADRSYGYKDHHIHGFFAQLADDGRNTLVEQTLRLTGVADKRIVRWRGAADLAAGLQFN